MVAGSAPSTLRRVRTSVWLVTSTSFSILNGFASISSDGTEITYAASAPGGLQTINVLDTTQQEVRVLTEPFAGGLLFPLFVR